MEYEEPCAGAQYKSDSGSLEVQSISLQAYRVLATAV
jgi:hypothetical protein